MISKNAHKDVFFLLAILLWGFAAPTLSFKFSAIYSSMKSIISAHSDSRSCLSASMPSSTATTPGGGGFKNAADVSILRVEALTKILGTASELIFK
jgi:hypothetical protein